MAISIIQHRLAALACIDEVQPVQIARLAALVFLHDFGKANRGFRARWSRDAPRIGHILPAVWLCTTEEFLCNLAESLPIAEILRWGTENAIPSVLAHHGSPVPATVSESMRHLWRPGDDGDPIADLAVLGTALRRWFPLAFTNGGPELPNAPRFWHAVAGLIMLADWVGSDQRSFPFADGRCTDRMTWARQQAPAILRGLGFNSVLYRKSLPKQPSFQQISNWPARPAQQVVGTCEGRTVIFESETGSGKTEAALYRFASLFARGEVDGLYFALQRESPLWRCSSG